MFYSNSRPDSRSRFYLLPARVVWQTGDPAPSAPENLLAESDDPCILKHDGRRPAGLLLDFGREIHGGIQLVAAPLEHKHPVRVRVRFGESVSEAMGAPNNDHAMHDLVTNVPWHGEHEVGNTGFRFVRIDLVDDRCELHLKHLRAVALHRDIEYVGTFECSDPRLNEIWRTGAHTVHLCMQDRVWNGVKRDRLVRLGDMYPETAAINAVFGAHEAVPASLDYMRDQTPLPRSMNDDSAASLWWVLCHGLWYRHHGDLSYLSAQREYLLPLLGLIQQQAGADNRECLPEHRFLDWPSSSDHAAVHAGLHALLTWALREGAWLCDALGERSHGDRCRKAVARLQAYVPPTTMNKAASALLVLAGMRDAKEVCRHVLAVDPLRGLSPFSGHIVLKARALAGDYGGCLDLIRAYWGGMLDLGATTFWEHFELDWARNSGRIDELTPEGKRDVHADFGDYCYVGLRRSLCHGWAAGPTAWLSEYVLGLQPLEPGFASVRVAPNLDDLTFAEGAIPTPQGVIRVRHERTSGGYVESGVTAPDGIRVVRV